MNEWKRTRSFFYTVDLDAAHDSKVDVISLDIPPDGVEAVAKACFFLGDRLLDGHAVKANQMVQQVDTKFLLVAVDGDVRRALLDHYATDCRDDANLLLLVPIDAIPFRLPEAVTGGRSVAVGERALAMYKIRQKWTDDPIMFVNGDRQDCRWCNLVKVSMHYALTNPYCVADWGMDLTDEEIKFVDKNRDAFAKFYKPS